LTTFIQKENEDQHLSSPKAEHSKHDSDIDNLTDLKHIK
jgi:hypothetical protein